MRNSSPNQQPLEPQQQASPKTVPLYHSVPAQNASISPDTTFVSAGSSVPSPVQVSAGTATQPMPTAVPSAQPPTAAPFDPTQAQPPYPQGAPYASAPVAEPKAEGLNVLQLEEDPSIPVVPSQPRKSKGNALLTVGIIACVVAIIVLVLTLLAIQFKPFGLFADNFTAPEPTTAQVESAFDKARVPEPDLSSIKYVDTKNLELDSLGEYEIGDVQYVDSGSTHEALCEVEGTAVWSNSSLTVVQPLFASMKFNRSSSTWDDGSLREGTITVQPSEAPDKETILADFPNILKEYDSTLAEMYKDATITEESTLSSDGGSMKVTLTKAKEDGTSITCTADTTISWNDNSGWVVRITSVDGDVATDPSAPAEQTPAEQPSAQPDPAPSNPGNTNKPTSGGTTSNGTVVYQLVCFSGELVEVPGTITFDSSGHILLKTDDALEVVLDHHTYAANYFEIVGNGSWSNGQHVTIIGEISASGTLSQAPLVINTSY